MQAPSTVCDDVPEVLGTEVLNNATESFQHVGEYTCLLKLFFKYNIYVLDLNLNKKSSEHEKGMHNYV